MLTSTEIKTTLLAVLIFSIIIANGQSADIIPYPLKEEIQSGVFNFTISSHIYCQKEFRNEAFFLQRLLLNEHKIRLAVTEHKNVHFVDGNIYLLISQFPADSLGEEGYVLRVDQKNIFITASSAAGIFYGIQSLRQIIQKKTGSNMAFVQCLIISDKPRFHWRAFLLDEGRYFKGEKVVKELLDEMALLKMNVFHWHLTDDQGWRIEIRKYPLLTQIGGTRKQSEVGTWLSNKFDRKVHSGFYTQQKIKEIIKYASDRHITIIPEIEMPGHASAAIAAYPWLGTENKKISVPVVFRIQLNVFNVANPRVIQFIHDVLDEVMELFPSKIIHIGGDEVKYDQWKNSAEVNEYMQKNNILSPADLQISFTNSISNYLEQKNHRMMGWNEIMRGQVFQNTDSADVKVQQKLSPNVIIHFWTGDPQIINEAAEKGYDVVNSYYEFTYLDYDYKTTSLEKAYSFDPIPSTLSEQLHSKILGLGCQMWGEWIPTVERMNYQVYPRIAAFAEIGWTEPARKNFIRFSNALPGYLMNIWKKRGIKSAEVTLKK